MHAGWLQYKMVQYKILEHSHPSYGTRCGSCNVTFSGSPGSHARTSPAVDILRARKGPRIGKTTNHSSPDCPNVPNTLCFANILLKNIVSTKYDAFFTPLHQHLSFMLPVGPLPPLRRRLRIQIKDGRHFEDHRAWRFQRSQ